VRDVCIFARQNLCTDPPYSKLDMVSCRNVLIYLDRGLQEQVIQTFHYSLRPNGYFLLGKAETIRGFADLFTTIDRKNNFYGKIPGSERSGFELWRRIPLVESGASPVRGRERPGTWSEVDLQRATDRIILARFDPPGVVVDEHLNIVFTRGRANSFLEMARGTPSLQLTHMLRDEVAGPIQTALTRAIEEDVPVEIERIEMGEGGSEEFSVDVVPLSATPGTPRYFLILFTPKADIPAVDRSDARLLATGANGDESIDRLRKDLQSTKRYMQSLIEDRDIKNQELASASEEIQSQNEELQSANEELETTKEEIQSANEELQTVNDELHQRNTSLAQAGNDLSNLLASVNLPVLMLNNDLLIRQFTPAAQRVMSVRSSDIGRPLGEIRIHLSVDDLEPIVHEVLETLAAKEIEVQDREHRWHLLRVRPYRTSENKIEGAVLSLMDIDQFRRVQQELSEARDFAGAIIAHIQTPLVVLNMDLTIRTANDAFGVLVNSPSGLEGRSFPDFAVAQWEMRTLLARLEEIRASGPGASFSLDHPGNSDTGVHLTVRGLVVQADGDRVFLLLIEDVTHRNRLAAALTDERNALRGQATLDARELKRTQDELRGLAWKLFTSQEEERRRVARELHDDITQKLALLHMELDQLAGETQDGGLHERLRPLREQTAALTDDVRHISHRLHPAILDDLGLPIALKALIEEFGEREKMPADYQQSDLPAVIPANVSAALYRIAQEALRNVAKHAGKTHVKLSLESTAGGLRMEVIDFGVGFDATDMRGAGLGLISMSERARLASGSVRVESTLGRGVAIRVDVPLTS